MTNIEIKRHIVTFDIMLLLTYTEYLNNNLNLYSLFIFIAFIANCYTNLSINKISKKNLALYFINIISFFIEMPIILYSRILVKYPFVLFLSLFAYIYLIYENNYTKNIKILIINKLFYISLSMVIFIFLVANIFIKKNLLDPIYIEYSMYIFFEIYRFIFVLINKKEKNYRRIIINIIYYILLGMMLILNYITIRKYYNIIFILTTILKLIIVRI